MRLLKEMETRELNGGATYQCPFCYGVKGGYWKVYAHALFTGCFKKNKALKWLWDAGRGCIDAGLQIAVCNTINAFGKVGKHAK